MDFRHNTGKRWQRSHLLVFDKFENIYSPIKKNIMKKLLPVFYCLLLAVDGRSQDRIEKYLPQTYQKAGKDFAGYLVYSVNYVRDRAEKDTDLKTIEQLSDDAYKSYLIKHPQISFIPVMKRVAPKLQIVQFKDFAQTVKGSITFRQLLSQISDAIYYK